MSQIWSQETQQAVKEARLKVCVYAGDVLVQETNDERVAAAVIDWIVKHKAEKALELIRQEEENDRNK